MSAIPTLPELLAPAGSPEALEAAVLGGCDAVYLGGSLFNARMHAKNFDRDALVRAVALCHAHGVKLYVTQNVQIYDREMEDAVEYASFLYEAGVDALIVADFGLIDVLHRVLPDFPLHASTQCTVHNRAGIEALSSLGVERVVGARELCEEDMRTLAAGDVPVEVFVHGAHCVSVSGQCLMSFAMGGRSGNRGECAQPCRLPYRIGKRESYCLSLKDMALAKEIPTLIEMGVSSLKIEGRMKSPAYVYGVTRIYRKLLDERRPATDAEMRTLEKLFSRDGFTDGYFRRKIDESMLGVRSEENKEWSRETEDVPALPPVPVGIKAEFHIGAPARLTLTDAFRSVTVTGDAVEEARTAPMTEDDFARNLTKFGGTPYTAGTCDVVCDDGAMMKIGAINALRRSALSALTGCERQKAPITLPHPGDNAKKSPMKTAFFLSPEQIPENAKDYFDAIFVPHDTFRPGCGANGIALPPVIFDHEWETVFRDARTAKENGAKYALVGNIGQIKEAKALGFFCVGDYRLNVFNRYTADVLYRMGLDRLILSPELSLPALRDLGDGAVVYGCFPLMLTERCILRDSVGCEKCRTFLVDRTGASFFVKGVYGHRNLIFNSVPVYMADRENDLSVVGLRHFLFTSENRERCARIIEAYKTRQASQERVRRIR